MEVHAMLKANTPCLTHFEIRNDLPCRVRKYERGTHGLQTFNVSETRSGRIGGGSGGSFERSTGWYSVSRSTGTRPAARIKRSSSVRGVNSEVFAPAS